MTELLLELTALVIFWICLAAWQRDRTARGRRLFIALAGSVFVWTAGSLADARATTPPLDVCRLVYLGVLTLPPLWLGLSLVVRGAAIAERAPWALALVMAPGAICYALLYQDPEVGRWFLAFGPDGEEMRGPLWWVNAGWSWAVCTLGSVHFIRSARSFRSQRERLRRVAVGGASLLPLLANAVHTTAEVPGLDPTPILLGALLVALRSELFSGDLLQALPVAQHDLVNQLPTPLILTDLDGNVTEINPAAQACLGVTKANALERSVEALLEDATFAPEFERWSIVASGREAGWMLLLANGGTGDGR